MSHPKVRQPELLVVHAVKHFLLYSTFSNYFETIFMCAIKQGISTATPLQKQMGTITARKATKSAITHQFKIAQICKLLNIIQNTKIKINILRDILTWDQL